MINLSLNELKLIAQIRNISDYENKSKEDLTKALSEPKPRTLKPETPKKTLETKPKTTPKQALKPETQKQTLKSEIPKKTPETEPKTLKPKIRKTPKPETKIEIKVNSKKLEKLRKDFDELRHKFSNKDEIRDYRKAFYIAKNCKHLFESEIKKKKELLSKSEIEKVIKHINKFKKGLNLRSFKIILIVLILKTLIIIIIITILLMMINTEKLEVLEYYLENLIVIITNQ